MGGWVGGWVGAWVVDSIVGWVGVWVVVGWLVIAWVSPRALGPIPNRATPKPGADCF